METTMSKNKETNCLKIECLRLMDREKFTKTFYIRGRDGTLWTGRLKRLIKRTLNSYDDGVLQYLSIKDRESLYELLKEIKQYPSDLSPRVETKEISEAILAELELRKKLKKTHGFAPKPYTY